MQPLQDVRILELGGRGPVSFCGMVLSDLGAEVISVTRPRPPDDITPLSDAGLGRGRSPIALNLKTPADLQRALDLVVDVDAIIEGFRPGVTEKLGIGPAQCHTLNPALVYGRITAWGQTGPLAEEPAHNINALALSGVLAHLGRADCLPAPPMNLVADGGGAMFLALGVVAGILYARKCGQGQVIDASMLDGAAMLSTMSHDLWHEGRWNLERGTNLNDSGAPFHDVYAAADGQLIAIGAVEEHTWKRLLEILEITGASPDRWNRQNWPWWRSRIATALAQRTRDEWSAIAEYSGACLSPVLTMAEAASHPHNKAREVFSSQGGAEYPSPTPRFSLTETTSTRRSE